MALAGINEMEYYNKQESNEALASFITSLNILRKNMAIYPSGHKAIQLAGDVLTKKAEVIFTKTSSITINVIKKNLLVNGKLLETKNTHIYNFTTFVSKLGIASLIFTRGLSSSEIQHLLQLIMKVQPIKHIYQYKEILDEINDFNHVRLRAVDLSSVKFVDEDTADSGKNETQSTIWQKFLLGCLSPELLEIQDADLLKIIKIYDQGSIKTFLQDFNISEERLVNSYRIVLEKNFHTASKQKDEFIDKQDFFNSMGKNMQGLSPELKEQFLAVSFDNLNGAIDEKSLEEMLHCMPGDMVVDVLTQAVLNKKMMSPMLIKLLSVLYRADKQTHTTTVERSSPSNPMWARIENIFSMEGYEKYLSEDYIEQLQNISLEAGDKQSSFSKGFSNKKYIKELQEQSVNRHLCTAMLFLLEGNIDEDVFIDYTLKISQIIPDLLETGDYRHLITIYKTFNKQMKKAISSDVCDAVAKVLNVYSEGRFTAKLAQDFGSKEIKQRREIEELIMLTGAANLPWLIEKFLKEKDIEKARRTYSLICRFGDRAANASLEKMLDSDFGEVIALLKLFRGSSRTGSAAKLRHLLNSKSKEVRLEVIRTLLKFNEPEAISPLRDLVKSKNDETAFKAMKIVYDYNVHSLTCTLATQIKTFYISSSDFKRNKAILTLLGRFGNVDALPILYKKAGARITLTSKFLKQTQEYLYKTLIGYPQSSIEEFIIRGLRSKNSNVAGICEKLNSKSRGDIK